MEGLLPHTELKVVNTGLHSHLKYLSPAMEKNVNKVHLDRKKIIICGIVVLYKEMKWVKNWKKIRIEQFYFLYL